MKHKICKYDTVLSENIVLRSKKNEKQKKYFKIFRIN